MKYDDANWHFNGEFQQDSPIEFGGVHIAMFLKWCIGKGWVGEFHRDEEPLDTQKVADGSMLATDFLFKYCDGKLTDEDLNEEGNKFAAAYYGDDGLFLVDYADHFGDLIYAAPEEAHDFEKFSEILANRLQSGILTEADLAARG